MIKEMKNVKDHIKYINYHSLFLYNLWKAYRKNLITIQHKDIYDVSYYLVETKEVMCIEVEQKNDTNILSEKFTISFYDKLDY
ncbi:hypothetical protein RV06_GL000581 [Enterococcus haemoperoxidus]|nr:hypothetical protein RV06_GL000581 [Enterococcus haemoperoxidus]